MRKFIFPIVALAFLLYSCNSSDDPNRPKVSLQADEYSIYNGEVFYIVFEFPSKHLMVPDMQVHIDVESTETTLPDSPQATAQNNLYLDYAIEKVEPWRGVGGAVTPGKWIVTVRESEDREHISKTTMRLRVGPSLAYGYQLSEEIKVVSIPQFTEETIDFMLPERISYMLPNDQHSVNPAFAYVDYSDTMLKGEVFGVDWMKDMKAEIISNGSENCFTVTLPADRERHSLLITPVANQFALLTGTDFPVKAKVRFSITDITGGVIAFDREVLFYPPAITVPAAETGLEVGEGFDIDVPMKDILAKVGITQGYFESLQGVTYSMYTGSEYPDGASPVVGLECDQSLGSEEITNTDGFIMNLADFGLHPQGARPNPIPEGYSETYYGVLIVAVTDPMTLRPLISAKVRLEVVYKPTTSGV